jgi:nitroreductase
MARKNIIFGPLRKLKALIWHQLYGLVVPAQYREYVNTVAKIRIMQTDSRYQNHEYWTQKLRQAAHILDKGINTDQWEAGRSVFWYERAKEILEEIEVPEGTEDSSIVWANDVIKRYENLQSQKKNCRRIRPNLEFGCYNEELQYVIRERRSVRSFNEQKVPLDVIEKIIEVINWSPTSCNKQTAKIFVTNNPSLSRICLSTCKGGTGFGEFVPSFLCFCADLRSYSLPEEMFLPFIDISLGIENCALVSYSLGMSLTLLSWALHTDADEKKLRSLLEIPEYYQIIVNGVLGFPKYIPEAPQRKPVKSTYEIIS